MEENSVDGSTYETVVWDGAGACKKRGQAAHVEISTEYWARTGDYKAMADVSSLTWVLAPNIRIKGRS